MIFTGHHYQPKHIAILKDCLSQMIDVFEMEGMAPHLLRNCQRPMDISLK